MSLLNTSFWEVFKASFSPGVWKEIWPAALDTLYMTFIAALITLVFGLLLGIIMTLTAKDGLRPVRTFNTSMGWLVNCLRSLPQMIMIILMIPVARMVLGQSYGINSCIIALAASCIPMYARIVQSSLLEISKGKIEAAKSMGSSNLQIVLRVLLPETLPSLIRGFTVAVIAIISMSALAGNFGAGGIGDIAVRFGFQRFQHEVLFACVYVLIIIVQIVQFAGDFASKLILKKRHLI
ncbi:D-methionine transport system permease protein [Ruminiclostridium sufflavum DSM 19573]|uniref:D-methionine transport system permease protein n=1 Tax=Ruminiclostridium sufflavum DSM 19573 TaxID=1121337 RepID=A0A318XM91_9FIRM|nr:methionine ABC transporter permease [Ruminiclostridium sufflavum]PYG88547.1 D-methionine transport system permease protein [Ruminiclostridium sufflavum DSM 19573]